MLDFFINEFFSQILTCDFFTDNLFDRFFRAIGGGGRTYASGRILGLGSESFRAQNFSGLIQKNLFVAEAKGVAEAEVKNRSVLDYFVIDLLGGKRTFARGKVLGRELVSFCAWDIFDEMQKVWSIVVGVSTD